MDIPLLIILLSCFTSCLFFHVVVGVHDVGGDSDTPATAMDKQMHKLQPHRCLDEERSALWEFKQGLTIIRGSAGYHKMDSWKAGGDCCSSWDGVECDQVTGHVIGLDLSWNFDTSDSYINGFISGNSTLFQLFHLQKLNFSFNKLQGQIPSSIFHFSNLSSLGLSYNNDLRLHRPDLKDLVHNFTKLEHLHLDDVDMTGSTLPDSLSNYTSLKSLRLESCELGGEIPSGIFHLPKLLILDVSSNPSLSGKLPEFDSNNPFEELRIGFSNISGKISSINKLSSLKVLDIAYCGFSGNLTSLGRLVNLTYLDLSGNHFTGQITPTWLANLTQLVIVDLSNNQLIGTIPNTFSNLHKLQVLDLHLNNLDGIVELDMFHKLADLYLLQLSQNNLSLIVNDSTGSVVQHNYRTLGLGFCNLSKFPAFLQSQSELRWLDLSENIIPGVVPKWIWNHSLGIQLLNISHNFLTTIEDHPVMLPWSSLHTLDISFNMLQGSLPVPPLHIKHYLASNNNWSGHLSPLFCNLSYLSILDVSNCNISGTIPQCLGTSLSVLNMRNNNFYGTIPQLWKHGSSLNMIALSQNQLQGTVPRSLSNCTMLEFIDFGNNQLVDTFPSWLGDLPELKILMLQSNRFHGEIQKLEGNSQFVKLLVIDLSFNGFSGKIPSMYFQSWTAMESLDADERMQYMKIEITGAVGYIASKDSYYEYSMKITNKGMKMVYPKIQNILRGIDFSHNQFEGEIPTSLAKLKGLHFLNLGYNNLTGTIPSWLGNLQQLESIDLSHNILSGKIPQELSQLSFMSFFNVSYNNLSGIIPHDGQFETFENSSYVGNPGLLADPPSLPPTLKVEEEEDAQVFDKTEWMMILAGCGSGLVVGVILGNEFVVRKPMLFVKLFGRWL